MSELVAYALTASKVRLTRQDDEYRVELVFELPIAGEPVELVMDSDLAGAVSVAEALLAAVRMADDEGWTRHE